MYLFVRGKFLRLCYCLLNSLPLIRCLDPYHRGGAEKRSKDLLEAYWTLSDPTQRQNFQQRPAQDIRPWKMYPKAMAAGVVLFLVIPGRESGCSIAALVGGCVNTRESGCSIAALVGGMR
jgi:hypothetical protein